MSSGAFPRGNAPFYNYSFSPLITANGEMVFLIFFSRNSSKNFCRSTFNPGIERGDTNTASGIDTAVTSFLPLVLERNCFNIAPTTEYPFRWASAMYPRRLQGFLSRYPFSFSKLTLPATLLTRLFTKRSSPFGWLLSLCTHYVYNHLLSTPTPFAPLFCFCVCENSKSADINSDRGVLHYCDKMEATARKVWGNPVFASGVFSC